MYFFVVISSIMFGGMCLMSTWGQELKKNILKPKDCRPRYRQQPRDSFSGSTKSSNYDVVLTSNGQLHRLLVAAILSKAGYRVLLLEKQSTVGRKLVDGQCNPVSFDVS